jgi:lipopolysaccharide export LptBFGC system permease protein LptF
VIVLPALLAVLLIAVAIAMIGLSGNPWIGDEVMAEMSGANYGPPAAPIQADASR